MSDSHRSLDGLTSIIGFTGFAVPARARFIGQFVGSTLYTSITCGLVAGQLGAMSPIGPLVPFVAGSWVGYTWGCVGFWKRAKEKTMAFAKRYPRVLAHSLESDFELDVLKEEDHEVPKNSSSEEGATEKISLEEWIVAGGMKRMSLAVLAAQGCEEDIGEMQKSQRQKIIDGYGDKDC